MIKNRFKSVCIKNIINDSSLNFIIENKNKELVDKDFIFNYLDKNNITFHRRILQDRTAKI